MTKIQLFCLFPVVLMPSAEIHNFQSDTINQSLEKGLSAANHAPVRSAQCVNGGAITYCSRKTAYGLSADQSLSIHNMIQCGQGAVA